MANKKKSNSNKPCQVWSLEENFHVFFGGAEKSEPEEIGPTNDNNHSPVLSKCCYHHSVIQSYNYISNGELY